MGKRMSDADEALRKGSTGYSWGSLARGDQMFYAKLFRGRSGTIIAALCVAALVALAAVLYR